MMSSIWRTLIITATLVSTCLGANTQTVHFDRDLVKTSVGTSGQAISVKYDGTEVVAISQNLSLAGQRVVVPLAQGETAAMVRAESAGTIVLTTLSDNCQPDIPTADNALYTETIVALSRDNRLGRQVLENSGEITVNNTRYALLMLLPVTLQGDSLMFSESLNLYVGDRLLSSDQLLSGDNFTGMDLSHRSSAERSVGSIDPNYVIITSAALAPVLERLATYKSMTGYRPLIAAVEDIFALYSGRDPAEQLREYLKTFYASGGQYVLLAGDETIVPIRYAYPYNVSSSPSPDLLQVCDLYYADLTGEWNLDDDDTWGERTQDAPDLTPELLVGRLPLTDSTEFSDYIDKLITYETNPGDGDRSYLARTLFYSSDQMRDYEGIGQHGTISGAFPDNFDIDTSLAVEHSSGDDPAPDNTVPVELKAAMTDAYGIVHVIAHGRSDGFVVRSSNYNEWPKSYLLAAPQNGGQGSLDSVLFTDKPAFYYSLACNNGAFDYDQLPLGESPTMVQDLMGARNGAVGMVAYSRWGWVNSSHLLQRAFFDSLFAHPERPAVEAMYAAKEVFFYYRDLVFGQNFYGDPTLDIYTGIPHDLDVDLQESTGSLTVTVSDEGSHASNVRAILCGLNGEVVAETTTDGSGQATFSGIDTRARHVLSLVHQTCLVKQIDIDPTFVTDVDDDLPTGLPGDFALAQNYPNPFNPSTRIAYDLPVGSNVVLEVFNALGQRVDRLVNGYQAAGSYELSWSADDGQGRELASGVYFYRLQAEETRIVRKMILAR